MTKIPDWKNVLDAINDISGSNNALRTARIANDEMTKAVELASKVAGEHYSRMAAITGPATLLQQRNTETILKMFRTSIANMIGYNRQWEIITGASIASAIQDSISGMRFINDFNHIKQFNLDFARIMGDNSWQAATETILRGNREMLDKTIESARQLLEMYEEEIPNFSSLTRVDVPVLPIKPKPYNGPAYECVARFQEHIEAMNQRARAEGKNVVVIGKTPEGEILWRWQAQVIDAYFIHVVGVDIDGEEQDFTIHFSEFRVSVSLKEPIELEEDLTEKIN